MRSESTSAFGQPRLTKPTRPGRPAVVDVDVAIRCEKCRGENFGPRIVAHRPNRLAHQRTAPTIAAFVRADHAREAADQSRRRAAARMSGLDSGRAERTHQARVAPSLRCTSGRTRLTHLA